MGRKVMIFVGCLISIAWGIAHIIPLHSVVNGFGNISIDNRRIIQMEWLNESLILIFIGIINGAVTIVKSKESVIKNVVYTTTFFLLLSMATLSFFTGFQINFIPYKLCPILFLFSGILIFQGALIKK